MLSGKITTDHAKDTWLIVNVQLLTIIIQILFLHQIVVAVVAILFASFAINANVLQPALLVSTKSRKVLHKLLMSDNLL